jgi:hypothetical protein
MPASDFEELRIVGKIEKNAGAFIKARIIRAYGHRMADFRIFLPGTSKQIGTREGFTLRVEKLPDFLALVEKTLRSEGLPPGGPDGAGAEGEDATA